MSKKKQPKQTHSPIDTLEENLEHLGEQIDQLNEGLEQLEKKLGFFHPVSLLATWFGAGKIPFMPGTMGTLAALPFAWLIQSHGGAEGLIIAALLTFFLGILIADRYMKLSFTSHDPQEIVIDEVAGMWLLLAAFPLSIEAYTAAFLIFRFFDIVKPWPISLCNDKVMGGFGVMLDDLLAAIYPVFIIGILAMLSVVFGSDMLINFYEFIGGDGTF